MTSQAGEKQTKERLAIVPASYLMLLQRGKVLLLRRYNTGYEDGKYSVAAGHLELGETFTQCLIREVEEEIGIVLSPEDVEMVHAMHRNSGTANNGNRMDMFFVARKWEGDIENREPNKCDDVSWFDLDDLPENIIPYMRHAIECIGRRECYSEYGWGATMNK